MLPKTVIGLFLFTLYVIGFLALVRTLFLLPVPGGWERILLLAVLGLIPISWLGADGSIRYLVGAACLAGLGGLLLYLIDQVHCSNSLVCLKNSDWRITARELGWYIVLALPGTLYWVKTRWMRRKSH